MRHHTLSDAAFADLAAGRPSASTLAELRRAQLSKHLLLLSAILPAAPRHWYADLQAADPAVIRSIAADPLFGAWAAGCLAALNSGAAPGEAGVDRLAELTAARPAGRRLTATHEGLTVEVRLEDTDPVRARLGLTPTARLTDAEAAHWQDCLNEAWHLLVTRHRPAAEVLAALLSVIVPVEPDPAARGISATSAHAFGAVAMSTPLNGTELAVGLLHEIQHSLLNAVDYLFDLHTAPAALGYSPWRDDPRPASGILHGAYAYVAVTRFWQIEAANPRPGALAAFEFARWRAAILASADELLAGGGLTPAGTRFVGALRDEVRSWLSVPVPPDVGRLAASANADHYLRWRLRNLAVDPAAVRRSVAAWHRGDPEPPQAPPARLMPAPRRALEHSNRLALTHRLLRTAVPSHDFDELQLAASDSSPRSLGGDLAYLRGDYPAARDAYLTRIGADAGDDAAWAGLGLVSPQRALRETPELVAAVVRALGDADPEAVAEWISG